MTNETARRLSCPLLSSPALPISPSAHQLLPISSPFISLSLPLLRLPSSRRYLLFSTSRQAKWSLPRSSREKRCTIIELSCPPPPHRSPTCCTTHPPSLVSTAHFTALHCERCLRFLIESSSPSSVTFHCMRVCMSLQRDSCISFLHAFSLSPF